MAEEGALYILANLNLRAFEGFVPVDLTVFFQTSDSREKVNATIIDYLGEMLVFADVEDEQHGYFALAVPSVARIREIESWVEKVEGVRNVRVEILHDILSARRFYEEQVRNALELPFRIPRKKSTPKIHEVMQRPLSGILKS